MLSRIVDIRQGEVGRALLAFVILMLVVGSYTVVKTVRDAVFLSKFGVTQLSFIAIGLAFLTSLIVSLYLRLTGGIPRNYLILGTNIVVAGSLTGIWMLLGPSSADWVPWVLYIWSSVFGVFTVMQFWLLANDLFDPREAKRLFGFVGAGAILGGMSGGFLSKWLATAITTRGLLLVAGGMLILSALLANVVWPLRRREPGAGAGAAKKKADSKPPKRGFAVVKDNPYVRLIGTALLLSTLATTLLDWQFKAITKAHFAGRTDEMAAFFGSLFGYLSLASFLLQTFITGWLLRKFGIALGLLMLPVSLLLGSFGILFHGLLPISRLTAASGAKVAEGGLRFAIDKASMELMWLPVPPKVKEQGKAFVDTVVDRFGTGLTGLLWLALAGAGITTPGRVHFISILVLAAIVGWVSVLLRARRAYVNAFRQTLATRSLDLDQLTIGLMDAGVQDSIRQTLRSEDAREVSFALYLLRDVDPLPDLSGPLAHADPTVRCEALRLLTERGDRRHRRAALDSLGHGSPEVREAAVIFLQKTCPAGGDQLLEQLDQQSPHVRFAVAVIGLGAPDRAMAAAGAIREQLATAQGHDRREKVRLLAGAPPEMAAALLAPLLSDAEPEIVQAALWATGRARAAGLVPTLLPMLESRSTRPRTAAALREIGRPALPQLRERLAADNTPLEAKLALARLLGGSGDPTLAADLIALLRHEDPRLSRRALQALARLRATTDLTIDAQQTQALIDERTDEVYRDLLLLGFGSWPRARGADAPDGLLEQTLREAADSQLSSIFTLLSLVNDPADIRAAHRAARSPLKSVRASAIEFLDNVLQKNARERLLPLLEEADDKQFSAMAKRVIGATVEDRVTALTRLLRGRDPWLRAVAGWTAGQEQLEALRSELERIAEGEDDLARVSRRSLGWLDGGKIEESTMGLTLVEKALKLKTVDVLQRCSSEDLAQVAQIAEEVELEPGTPIYAEGDAPDALFVVISGAVKLTRGEQEIGTVGQGEAFGTWALFDEAPRVAAAIATGPTTMLKVDREEFLELLADRVDIVQAVFKAMVARLRQLADVVRDTP